MAPVGSPSLLSPTSPPLSKSYPVGISEIINTWGDGTGQCGILARTETQHNL